MKIITCAFAILAAVSTAAVAKDLKQDKAAPTPTVKAQVMTDADMDKITAGEAFAPGRGTYNALGNANSNSNVSLHGLGVCQTGQSGHCL